MDADGEDMKLEEVRTQRRMTLQKREQPKIAEVYNQRFEPLAYHSCQTWYWFDKCQIIWRKSLFRFQDIMQK